MYVQYRINIRDPDRDSLSSFDRSAIQSAMRTDLVFYFWKYLQTLPSMARMGVVKEA